MLHVVNNGTTKQVLVTPITTSPAVSHYSGLTRPPSTFQQLCVQVYSWCVDSQVLSLSSYFGYCIYSEMSLQ